MASHQKTRVAVHGETLLRRLRQDDRGQSLLEFAFASIVFFMTIFGTLEFGLAVHRYNMVSNLAQEGARWAAVRGSSSLPSMQASAADVQDFVQSRAGFSVTVTTTPVPSGVTQGNPVTVTVSSTYTPIVGLLPSAAWNLSSTSTMVVQR